MMNKGTEDFGVDTQYIGDMYTPDESETLEYKKLAFEVKFFVERKKFQKL